MTTVSRCALIHQWNQGDLGKLLPVNRKARLGRNPVTGETFKIKAKKVVKFRVAKAAKNAILGVKK